MAGRQRNERVTPKVLQKLMVSSISPRALLKEGEMTEWSAIIDCLTVRISSAGETWSEQSTPRPSG